MQTTEDIQAAVASASSRSSQSRRTLYVGGLDEAVTQSLLHAAMIPFGPIKSVELVQESAWNKGSYNPNNNEQQQQPPPPIPETPSHKGFGFVEFEDAEDAAEAIYNMDGAELLGRTLNVTVAQKSAQQHRLDSNKPIWSSDEWLREQVAGNNEQAIKANEEKQAMEVTALQ